MAYWDYYPPYVTVAEKKAKAKKKLEQLLKKQPDLKPIIIEGRTIAKSWWGKSWNKNLERYADYSNRLGRGRSYVSNNAVLDLKIESGTVNSLVQGSESKPYEITIKINAINNKSWEEIKKACMGKFDSLGELLEGKFPKSLGEILLVKDLGLFPSPNEIGFSCSCPDSAYMCKHVAATLYGIGARLDEDPMLFFKLRNVAVNDLITETVQNKTKSMLEKAETKSKRAINDVDISKVFGIDFDDINSVEFSDNSLPKKEKSPKKNVVKKTKSNPSKALNLNDLIFEIIKQSPHGLSITNIIKKTGYDEKKISNSINKLKKQNKITEKGKKYLVLQK